MDENKYAKCDSNAQVSPWYPSYKFIFLLYLPASISPWEIVAPRTLYYRCTDVQQGNMHQLFLKFLVIPSERLLL